EIVGRHFYADEWKGDEFWSGYLNSQFQLDDGTLGDARPYERAVATGLLRHFRPDITPKSPEALTDELWAVAQALFPQYLNERRAAAVRVRKAKEKLRDLCAKGELVGAYRWDSGDHKPIEPTRWNTEKYLEWLKKGYVPYSDVGSSYGGSYGYHEHYLFIENEGLEALKTPAPNTISVPSEPSYLSPYLRLMIAVSQELNMSPDHQPKKADVEAKIREISKRPGMPIMGIKAVGYAATFIREVESQAGAASNSRRMRE
ncbi:MAG: hypothetical protein J0H60_25565, partial [Rhizobiales bacterium]|nr:hypothetical protein [Hyphomicrobiales bacterium]